MAALIANGTAKRILGKLSSLIGLALFAVAIWVIAQEVDRVGWDALKHGFFATPLGALASALALTVAAYALLTSYDVLAFRYVGRDLPQSKIMLAAFVGYAFSNSISMTPSMAARFRFYSSWGLKGSEIAKVFFFHLLSTWLGFLVVGGTILVIEPTPISASPFLTFDERRWVGAGLWSLVVAYFLAVRFFKDGITLKGTHFRPPPGRILITQIIVATADWALIGLIPYVLLHAQIPAGAHLSYISFLSVFLMAQILQILSHVPGGIGVFEGTILFLLKADIPSPAILTSLLVYRVIYTVIPLVAAAPIFLGFEMRRKRRAGIAATESLGQTRAPSPEKTQWPAKPPRRSSQRRPPKRP